VFTIRARVQGAPDCSGTHTVCRRNTPRSVGLQVVGNGFFRGSTGTCSRIPKSSSFCSTVRKHMFARFQIPVDDSNLHEDASSAESSASRDLCRPHLLFGNRARWMRPRQRSPSMNSITRRGGPAFRTCRRFQHAYSEPPRRCALPLARTRLACGSEFSFEFANHLERHDHAPGASTLGLVLPHPFPPSPT